jgi:hypothetical protein
VAADVRRRLKWLTATSSKKTREDAVDDYHNNWLEDFLGGPVIGL